MDTDQLANEANDGGNDAETPPENAAPPVTREEFDSVLKRLDETTKMNERLLSVLEVNRAPASQPRPQPTPEPEIVITDEDEGDTRTMKLVRRELRGIERQLTNLQNFGLGTMGKLADRTAVASMSPEDAALVKRFRPDVDRYLAGLDAATRANPESLDYVLRLVKADHFAELRDEAVEAAGRQAVKTARPGTPATRAAGGGGTGTVEALPTPEDLFGKDSPQVRAIDERGGPDAWARKSSQGRHKNWADYVKNYQKWNGGK